MFILLFFSRQRDMTEMSLQSRGMWSDENLRQAVRRVVMQGMSKSAAVNNIRRPKCRDISKVESVVGVENVMEKPCILTCVKEQELVNKILDMEAKLIYDLLL